MGESEEQSEKRSKMGRMSVSTAYGWPGVAGARQRAEANGIVVALLRKHSTKIAKKAMQRTEMNIV